MKRFSSRLVAIGVCLASVCIFAQPASAFFELTGGYSVNQASPSKLNAASSYPKLDSMSGFDASAILELIGMPFGVGVRYEDWEKKASNTAGGYDATYKRVSLLLDKRFIDTIGYLGVIGGIGVTNDFRYAITNGSTGKATGVSGSAGVEAGLKLGFLLVGAEVGYVYAPLSNLKDTSGNDLPINGSVVAINMSGVYARGTVGFSF